MPTAGTGEARSGRSGVGPTAASAPAHTDLRSISRVRSVPIALSTKAPPADADPVRPGLAVKPVIRISPRRARRTRRSGAHEEGTGRSDRRSRRTAHESSGFGLGVWARGTGLGAPASRRLGLRALRVLRGESCLDGSISCEDLARGSERGSHGGAGARRACRAPRTHIGHRRQGTGGGGTPCLRNNGDP